MKRKLKTLVASLAIFATMTASTFAATPAEEIKSELLSMGVPSSYVGSVVEYLQKIDITESQKNTVLGYINEAKALIGNTTDLGSLSADVKLKLKDLATKAGNTIGLTVKFGKDANGMTQMVVTDANGNTILCMTTADAMAIVKNFDADKITDLFVDMVNFSNSTANGNGEFTPVGGELNSTATGYAGAMAMGLSLVAGAGGVMHVSRKKLG